MLCFASDREEEFELGREFVLGVEAVAEVDTADAAVGVDLHSQRLDVVRAVSPPREIGQVELDLVPALVQTHRHRADERLHSCCALVVRCPKPSAHVLVVQYLHLKCEILLQLCENKMNE